MLGEEALDWTASGLGECFELLYEATPADPQIACAGNVLAFSFGGGLSPADEHLLELGAETELRDFREEFLRAVEPQLREVVEERSGVATSFYFAAFDPSARTTSVVFLL